MNEFADLIDRQRDFPKPGVTFFDFTPLHADPQRWRDALDHLSQRLKLLRFDKIAAVEAKGFVLGGALAERFAVPLVLVRKPGLTPGATISSSFAKEYGHGQYEMKRASVQADERVLVVYDIMAGPGASRAAFDLIEGQGGQVAGAAYVIELEYLHGREQLPGYELISLVAIKAPT